MPQTAKAALNLVALLVIAAVAAKYFLVDVVEVPDNGMAPTLVLGEQVLVWRHATADLADVMVCKHPVEPDQIVIGRAIAFAGSRIHTDHNGQLFVNGDQTGTQNGRTVRFYDVVRKRERTMTASEIDYFGQRTHEFFVEEGDRFSLRRPYTVESGMFLLGDNRSEDTYDSREFGEFQPADCTGQVFMRLRPAAIGSAELDHGYLELIK